MRLLSLFILSLFLSACIHETCTPPIPLPERTLLVYLAGDNNLSNEVRQKSNALLAGWQPSLGELVVLVDDQIHQSPHLLKAREKEGKMVFDTIKYYYEGNSASPSLLSAAISDMQRMAPARSYGLILFSHATGWLPQGAFEHPTTWRPGVRNARSVFMDGEREMTLDDFALALPDSLFHFIAFDMCFMAGVEVAYALRHKTPRLLGAAAEILSPGFTPIYSSHLPLLYQKEADLNGFAEAFYKYCDSQSGVYRSATISVLRTDSMEPLKSLTHRLQAQHTDFSPLGLQYFDRNGEPHLFYDFGQYLSTLGTTNLDRQEVEKLLTSTVLYKRHTGRMINIPIFTHSGLSVYIPQGSLPYLNAAYAQTAWQTR